VGRCAENAPSCPTHAHLPRVACIRLAAPHRTTRTHLVRLRLRIRIRVRDRVRVRVRVRPGLRLRLGSGLGLGSGLAYP